MKITPRGKRRLIFTRARVSLALLSLRKNGGLLVAQCFPVNYLVYENISTFQNIVSAMFKSVDKVIVDVFLSYQGSNLLKHEYNTMV